MKTKRLTEIYFVLLFSVGFTLFFTAQTENFPVGIIQFISGLMLIVFGIITIFTDYVMKYNIDINLVRRIKNEN